MGLDTECCLVVEDAGDSDVGPALRRFRLDLLAEHLGASVQEVAAACEREGSIRGAIRKICGAARCLKPLDLDAAPVVDGTAWVPDASFLDPEEPFHFDKVIDHFARAPEPQSSRGQFVKIAVMILVLLGLAAVWRLTPLADWLTIERLAQWAGVVDDRRVLMAVVVGTYVVASLIFVPVTLLVGATALILPPWQSFVCAMTGTVLSAWATYWVGRRLGKRTVRKVAGERLTRLNKYLARQGVLTVMIVRNLPVAPFTVVNIVAGTTRIKQGAYLLGTLLGMLPGILVITIFTDRMLQVFKNPSWINVLTAAGVLLVIGFGLWWLRKRLMHKFSS
jgi:uncharacterized membrane protein YdjX (TVP38/TMEM64 family)